MFHGLGLPGLVLLVGCPFIGEKDLTDRVDRDGDGYTVGYGPGADCHDNNSAIHPGAEEICDGVDNNCSGEADEGVTLSFHEDSDGDGYGHEFLTVEACAIGAGYVEDASDCDDGDPEVHPGVEEICDGKDNDCDETTADGGEEPYTFHLDLDGDGIGDVLAGDPDWSSSFSQLEASGSETQCTGSDSWAYCGAARLYSGADLVGSGSEYYGAQPIKSVYGPFSYEGFGAVVEPAGDLDGDGLTEILVSAPRAMDSAAGVRRAGRVYVLPGDGDFANIQNGGDLALATVTGDDNNDALGTSTSALGDLDQDGYADFGVGVPGVSVFSGNGFAGELPDKNGSVVVFLGPVGGVYKAQHAV